MFSAEPVVNVRSPTVIVPGLFPGAIVPPLATVTAPVSVPDPPSVPPLFTVKAEEALLPLISNRPALSTVAPEYELLAVRSRLPTPPFVNPPTPLSVPAVVVSVAGLTMTSSIKT